MGLWPVSMLAGAELLRVLWVPSTVVASAQGLVQVTFSRSDRTSPWPCRTQGQFSANFRRRPRVAPAPPSGRALPAGLVTRVCAGRLAPEVMQGIHRMLGSDARLT
jgi:hypothetical protein